MRKIIFVFALSLFSVSSFAQQKKSLVFIDKKNEVNLKLPKLTSQEKFAINLRKAGAGIVISTVLMGLSSVLSGNENSSTGVITVLKIAGSGGLVYSGIQLQQASNEYQKIIKEKSSN